jgi:hypothetical protein
MNRGVSVFSEGIILDDYCCTSDVLTLSLQNVFLSLQNVFCKNVLCSANVLPLSACFLNMCFVLTCAFLSQDKIALV